MVGLVTNWPVCMDTNTAGQTESTYRPVEAPTHPGRLPPPPTSPSDIAIVRVSVGLLEKGLAPTVVVVCQRPNK